VLDDLSTGRRENLSSVLGRPAVQLHVGSALRLEDLTGLVARADMIFHLAAAVGVRLIVDHPVETIETNIRATENVLSLAADRGCGVILASSSEVYGKRNGAPFTEDDDLVLGPTSRARWCYAASKIIDEFLALAYARQRMLPVTVVRLFNTIGPRQTGQYGMVVPRLVRQALLGEPLTVYGDGRQRRSFTWVGDVVDALLALADNPGARGEVFNLGHTEEIEILALAQLIRRRTGSSSELRLVPFEEAYDVGFEDMPRRLPDLTKIASLTGYRPTLALPEILDRVIAYERSQLGLPPD
jgi:UDP-glucose 4-epimerase